MPQTNVSSCVLSIITSFSSGLEVFKRFRERRDAKKRKIKKTPKAPTDEEVRLVRSLRQGPDDIGREYQRSIQAVGDDFATGDAIAQTSLAEILLKLNTGLVSIINTFVSNDRKKSQLDLQSLTALSERSRVDTCRTLRHLFRRVFQMRAQSPMPMQIQSQSLESRKHRSPVSDASQTKTRVATQKHTKARSPTLARVVIANSAKPSQIALVKPGERKARSTRPSRSPKNASASSPALIEPASTSKQSVVDSNLTRPAEPLASNDLLERQRPGRDLAMNVAAPMPLPRPDVHPATQSMSRLNSIPAPEREMPSPMPQTAPFPRIEPRRRKPTPTYYSIASGSTRLGEIPLHKWAEPYDFDAMSILNREAAKNGWPIVEELDASNTGKKKGLGILRIFRRNNSAKVR